jgi:hypothetical protein
MVRAADSIFEDSKWKNQDYVFPHDSLGKEAGTSALLEEVFPKQCWNIFGGQSEKIWWKRLCGGKQVPLGSWCSRIPCTDHLSVRSRAAFFVVHAVAVKSNSGAYYLSRRSCSQASKIWFAGL